MTEDDVDAALAIERRIYHDTPWDRYAFSLSCVKFGIRCIWLLKMPVVSRINWHLVYLN